MVFAILFSIGAVLITSLLYLALNPKTLELGGEGADLRYIAFTLILIILAAATIGSMLMLGKLA
jgi:hypothetical protein